MRLALRFIVRLKDALRLCLVAGLDALLFAGGFVLNVIDAPGTPNQTEYLFHCFTHGYECEAIGDIRVSEQSKGYNRAESEFWTSLNLGEDSGETLTPDSQKAIDNQRLEDGGEGRNRAPSVADDKVIMPYFIGNSSGLCHYWDSRFPLDLLAILLAISDRMFWFTRGKHRRENRSDTWRGGRQDEWRAG